MTLIWTILTSRLAGPIAAAVAVALACFLLATSLQVVGLKRAVAVAEKKADNLRTDLAQCRANTNALEDAIFRQNAAVTAAKAEGDRKAALAEKAASDARAVAESHRRRADRLVAARPRSCADVSDLIDGAAR